MANAHIQIAPDQGQFMRFLVELLGARKALEIGTFTGYSALCVAMALAPEGRLIACDMSDEWTGIARRYWREAGLAHKIDLRLNPALETLDELIAAGEADSFDFAFIDADKKQYDAYYERVLVLLRPGGVLALDNALWGGRVANPSHNENSTAALRTLNSKLRHDDRISLTMLAVGDGLTLARKRGAA